MKRRGRRSEKEKERKGEGERRENEGGKFGGDRRDWERGGTGRTVKAYKRVRVFVYGSGH